MAVVCGTFQAVVTHKCVFSCQIRLFTNTFTLTPYNGAEALVGY